MRTRSKSAMPNMLVRGEIESLAEQENDSRKRGIVTRRDYACNKNRGDVEI